VRARAAFAFASAPVAVPLLLLALCLAPGIASSLGLHEDHCLHHAGHAHLCLTHPTLALSAPLALVLAIACAALVAGVARGARRLARSQRELAALPLHACDDLAPGVHRVASARAFSVTSGLLRPQIWLSTALADALPARQLDAVLAHERAHAQRRDALRRLVAGVASWAHGPRLRRALRAELALASFAGSAVEARVRSLLEGAPPEPARGLFWLAPAALAAAIVLTPLLHHATEHVLGLLLRAW